MSSATFMFQQLVYFSREGLNLTRAVTMVTVHISFSFHLVVHLICFDFKAIKAKGES